MTSEKPNPDPLLDEAIIAAIENSPDSTAFARLPDFGFWQLNLHEAAELAVIDIWFSGEDDFGVEAPTDFDHDPKSRILRELLREPITLFISRLSKSIDQGTLKSSAISRDYEENIAPLQTYIRQEDLIDWLSERGHEAGDVFAEYQLDEAEVFNAACDEVATLRAMTKRELKQLSLFTLSARVDQYNDVESKTTKELISTLKAVIGENEELRKKAAHNTKSKPSKADRPLTLRSRRTLLSIIAALCDQAGIDPLARGAAQRVKEFTEMLGVPVDDETIRNAIKDIPDALDSRSS